MPKIQQAVGDVEPLRAGMCDRINLAISLNPDLFRPGRGRLVDFAARYGMARTVAQRLLTGKADPSPRLILALARDTKLPTDFFYGLTDSPEIDSRADEHDKISIRVFGAHGWTVNLHPQMLSARNPARLMIVPVGQLTNSAFAVPGDYVLVEHEEVVTSGAVYVVLPDSQQQTMLLAVSRHPTLPEYTLSAVNQPEFTCSADCIVFSQDRLAPGRLYLIGKVVGRINLFPTGLALNQLK